jgi:uncharacterized protein YggE
MHPSKDNGVSKCATGEAGVEQRRRSGRRSRRVPAWTICILIVGGLLMTVFISACGASSASGTPTSTAALSMAVGAPDTITVMGKATVSSAPDEAVLTLTVESDGTEPGAAMNANSTALTKVLERLQAEGVASTDIATANVTVNPVRTYNPNTGEETLAGYRAQNSITVTMKDAQTVGKVLSAAVEAGANIVSGPVWKLSDDTTAVAEALKQAVANARTKAEALAGAQGVKVGDVITMNETSVVQPIVPVYADVAAADSARGGAVVETPISAATLDVTATVTITYVLGR